MKWLKPKQKKAKGLLGIEIGPDGVTLSRVETRDGSQHVSLALKATCRSESDIADTLASWVSQYNLHDAECVWVLHPNDYNVLTIDAPSVPEAEYALAAKWLIKDLIDFDIENAAIDVFLPANTNAGSKKTLYVAVAQKTYLQPYVDVIEKAGLSLCAITLHEIALMQLAAKMSSSAAVGFFEMQRSRSKLLMLDGGSVAMMRSINIGVRKLSEFGDFDRIHDELTRSLRYYQESLKFNAPESLWLYPIAELDLAKSLLEACKPVLQPLNLEDLLTKSENISSEDINATLNALAGALKKPTVIDFNLLSAIKVVAPQTRLSHQNVLKALAGWVGVMVVVCGVALWNGYQDHSTFMAMQSQFDKINTQVQALRKQEPKLTDTALEDKVAMLADKIASKQQVVAVLNVEHNEDVAGYTPYLKALSKAIPTDVWLTQFEFNDHGFALFGQSEKTQDVPLFADALHQTEPFKTVHFKWLKMKKNGNGQGVRFSLASNADLAKDGQDE